MNKLLLASIISFFAGQAISNILFSSSQQHFIQEIHKKDLEITKLKSAIFTQEEITHINNIMKDCRKEVASKGEKI